MCDIDDGPDNYHTQQVDNLNLHPIRVGWYVMLNIILLINKFN